MSLHRFINLPSKVKLVHGSDTDVSTRTILKVNPNCFIITDIFYDETEGLADDKVAIPKSYVWNLETFTTEFKMQYGTPMQYLSEDLFNWLTS